MIAIQVKKATINQRLLAFLIDHVILSFLSGIIILLYIIIFQIDFVSMNFSEQENLAYLVAVSNYFLHCCKDFFNGHSLGKRILQIAVRSNNNLNKIPSIYRLLLRNIILIIWPIELLLLITGKNRRLGDRFAKTEVVSLSGDCNN